MSTRIEILARQRAELDARVESMRMPTMSDAPSWVDDTDDGKGGPQMLAYVSLYCAVVMLLIGLSCRAWVIEDDLAAKRDAAVVAQMEQGK